MKKYLNSSNPSPGQKPFLEEALKAGVVEVGKSYEIKEIRESRKRTGYLLIADTFQTFCFKGSGVCDAVLDCMNDMLSIDPACALYLEVNNTTVEGYELWIDDTEVRIWIHSKKQNILECFTSTLKQTTQTRSRQKA